MAKTAEERLNEQLNPLLGSVPADETGPGASLVNTSKTSAATSSVNPVTPSGAGDSPWSSSNPFRKSSLDTHRTHGLAKETSTIATSEGPLSSSTVYPSPPQSSSPRRSIDRNYRADLSSNTISTRARRSSSLRELFPDDPSVYPLNQLSREKAEADKARHMRKHHHIAPDTIDTLDSAGIGHYHHEGPYDATLLARNNSYTSSPVAAVAGTNTEALKATPREKIVDSVTSHRPLEGVAIYPPGTTDPEGRTYHYQEGENMMTDLNPEGGPYNRWSGLDYHPDDVKGQAEPAYSIEKRRKEANLEGKYGASGHLEEESESIEMQTQTQTKPSAGSRGDAVTSSYAGDVDSVEPGAHRRESLGGKLKRRIGSLRRKDGGDD